MGSVKKAVDSRPPVLMLTDIAWGWSHYGWKPARGIEYACGLVLLASISSFFNKRVIFRLLWFPLWTLFPFVFVLDKAQNAQQLHERIQSSSMDAKLEALKDLASLSRDVTFAQEFINLDGISLLTQMVESGTE